mgnify:CR=1 FL=1
MNQLSEELIPLTEQEKSHNELIHKLRDELNIDLQKTDDFADFPWKMTGDQLQSTLFFSEKDLQHIDLILKDGYQRHKAKHVALLFRKMRGRNAHNLSPLVRGEAGPAFVFDGGDDTAVALESSQLPKEWLHSVLAFGLYPTFMAVVHKGWLGAQEERIESAEQYTALKDHINRLKSELVATLQTDQQFSERITLMSHKEKIAYLRAHTEFQNQFQSELKALNISEIKETDYGQKLDQIKKLTSDLAHHREDLHEIHGSVLDAALRFDPYSEQTQKIMQDMNELSDASAQKWTAFIESRIASNFTESGLGSMYWGMTVFETRALVNLTSDITHIPLETVTETIGKVGDHLNAMGQAQMVLAGLAKSGIGIKEVRSLKEWLKEIKHSSFGKDNEKLAHIKEKIHQFNTDKRSIMIKDVVGNMTLTAGQLGMVLGGSLCLSANLLLYSGVVLTISGVVATQLVAQYMNGQFNYIDSLSEKELEILKSKGRSGETLEEIIYHRAEDLYQYARDQAPARIWQKIYKQIFAHPKLSGQKILSLVHSSISDDEKSYKQLYHEVLEKIAPDDPNLTKALKRAHSNRIDDQLNLLNQVGDHLEALHLNQDYDAATNTSEHAMQDLFRASRSLGIENELERRLIKELVNHKDSFKKDYNIDIHDFLTEIKVMKNKQPWKVPNPIQPLFNTAELIGVPLWKINIGQLIHFGSKEDKIFLLNKGALYTRLGEEGRFSGDQKRPLTEIFLNKKSWANFFGRDRRSIFLQSLHGKGRHILRSNVMRPIMHATTQQIELSNKMQGVIQSEAVYTTRLGLDNNELNHAFLATASKGLSQTEAFVENQLNLSLLRILPDTQHPDALIKDRFVEQVKAISEQASSTANEVASRGFIHYLTNTPKQDYVATFLLNIGDQKYALALEGNKLFLYESGTGTIYSAQGVTKIKKVMQRLKNKQSSARLWQVQKVMFNDSEMLDTHVNSISQTLETSDSILHQIDQSQGFVEIFNHHVSRSMLLNLGLSDPQTGQLLSIEQLKSLHKITEGSSYSLNTDYFNLWLKSAFPRKVEQVSKWLQYIKHSENIDLKLIGDTESIKRYEASIQESNQDIDIFDHTPPPSIDMQRLSRVLSRINMGYAGLMMPGGIYQFKQSLDQGDTYEAVKGGLSTAVDTTDIVLDLIANNTVVKSRMMIAGRLGAFTNFLGAGLSTWHAVDAFKHSQKATGQERTDYLVSGSLAVAGTLVSVATGIASMITFTAGPVGAAIGLAIGFAQGTYNAYRATRYLKVVGISSFDRFRAGACVFFGFDVPQGIQDKAAVNQIIKNNENSKRVALDSEHWMKQGIDKVVYSAPAVHLDDPDFNIYERHDYYHVAQPKMNTSLSSMRKTRQVDSTLNQKFDSSIAQAHSLEVTRDTHNLYHKNATLFILGDGHDTALGDQDKRNIFNIHGWGYKNYTGGRQADTFQIEQWKEAGLSHSVLDGAQGYDIVDLTNYEQKEQEQQVGVNIDLLEQKLKLSEFDQAQLLHIEGVLGSQYDDHIVGSDVSNTLTGNAGNDKIYGRDGDDTLSGGKGRDLLKGGSGQDSYIVLVNDFLPEHTPESSISMSDIAQLSSDFDIIDNSIDVWPTLYDAALLEQDMLNTDIKYLELSQEDDHLLVQTSLQWIKFQSVLRDIQIELNELQKVMSVEPTLKYQMLIAKPKLDQLNFEGGCSVQDIKHIIAALEQPNSLSSQQVIDAMFSKIPASDELFTIAKVKHYFKGQIHQHLSFLDMFGNNYTVSKNHSGNWIVGGVTLSSQYKSGVKMDLSKQTLIDSHDVTHRLLSLHIDDVLATDDSDVIQGNKNDNILDGAGGFDSIKGGAGDDILRAGQGGAFLDGEVGNDRYEISTGQGNIEIRMSSHATDSDTLVFCNGLQNLETQLDQGDIQLRYADTTVRLLDATHADVNPMSVLVINDQKKDRSMLGLTLNQEGFDLHSIDLANEEKTNYIVNLRDQFYAYNGRRTDLSNYMKQQKLIAVKMTDDDDIYHARQGQNYVTGQGGEDKYVIDETTTEITIDNYDKAQALDTLQWQDATFEDVCVVRADADLVMYNASHSEQKVVLFKYYEDTAYQHLQVKLDNLNHTIQVNELIQSMAGFEDNEYDMMSSTANLSHPRPSSLTVSDLS